MGPDLFDGLDGTGGTDGTDDVRVLAAAQSQAPREVVPAAEQPVQAALDLGDAPDTTRPSGLPEMTGVERVRAEPRGARARRQRARARPVRADARRARHHPQPRPAAPPRGSEPAGGRREGRDADPADPLGPPGGVPDPRRRDRAGRRHLLRGRPGPVRGHGVPLLDARRAGCCAAPARAGCRCARPVRGSLPPLWEAWTDGGLDGVRDAIAAADERAVEQAGYTAQATEGAAASRSPRPFFVGSTPSRRCRGRAAGTTAADAPAAWAAASGTDGCWCTPAGSGSRRTPTCGRPARTPRRPPRTWPRRLASATPCRWRGACGTGRRDRPGDLVGDHDLAGRAGAPPARPRVVHRGATTRCASSAPRVPRLVEATAWQTSSRRGGDRAAATWPAHPARPWSGRPSSAWSPTCPHSRVRRVSRSPWSTSAAAPAASPSRWPGSGTTSPSSTPAPTPSPPCSVAPPRPVPPSACTVSRPTPGRLDDVAAPGTVDLVCCHGVLEYVDDPAAALSAVARLLRPGGAASVLVAQRSAVVVARALAGRFAEASRALEDPDGRWGAADPLPRRFDAASVVQPAHGRRPRTARPARGPPVQRPGARGARRRRGGAQRAARPRAGGRRPPRPPGSRGARHPPARAGPPPLIRAPPTPARSAAQRHPDAAPRVPRSRSGRPPAVRSRSDARPPAVRSRADAHRPAVPPLSVACATVVVCASPSAPAAPPGAAPATRAASDGPSLADRAGPATRVVS
nr:methyltransferase domain-containing protein [Angustibacter aerolatus]